MKKIVVALVTLLFMAGLVGCAATGPAGAKVKCPACGHEFMVPDDA